tara:strand:- start:993 stop:2681 length:1689 start_codon:yes stop_codon:yes gene_type:complete
LKKIRLGSRTSKLAMWQSELAAGKLRDNDAEVDMIGIKSTGDLSLGGNLSTNVGQFVKSVDERLFLDDIDIAVHSSKDVPVDYDDRISTLAYLERGVTSDIILLSYEGKGTKRLGEVINSSESSDLDMVLDTFPKGGRIGTSSVRRQSFFLSKRDDVIPLAIRGRVETRIERLLQGRVEGIILAEAGIQRLAQLDALPEGSLDIHAMRINPIDWPTAPGQGAIVVHCLTEKLTEFSWVREILNHHNTEVSVGEERRILKYLGGGCRTPVGVECVDGESHGYIAPEDWRDRYSSGGNFELLAIDKNGPLPESETDSDTKHDMGFRGSSRLVSTLNSDRMRVKLGDIGIEVLNTPVIELTEIKDNWPEFRLNFSIPRNKWPILVLTSPFASKCASKMIEVIPDLGRIQWLAIGAGTARSCFQHGNPASICANAKNSKELEKYIKKNISKCVPLLIPRSNVGTDDMVNNLRKSGFTVSSWVGYQNSRKIVEFDGMERNDVLLISSPSSARSWDYNELPVPDTVICMGTTTETEIQSIERFNNTELIVLDGPVTESITLWWRDNGK